MFRHSFTYRRPSLARKIPFFVFCNCFGKACSDALALEQITCDFPVRLCAYYFETLVVCLRSPITGASAKFWRHTIAVVRSIFPSNFVHTKNTWKTHWTDLNTRKTSHSQERVQRNPKRVTNRGCDLLRLQNCVEVDNSAAKIIPKTCTQIICGPEYCIITYLGQRMVVELTGCKRPKKERPFLAWPSLACQIRPFPWGLTSIKYKHVVCLWCKDNTCDKTSKTFAKVKIRHSRNNYSLNFLLVTF